MSRLYDALTAIERRAPRVLAQADLPPIARAVPPSRRRWLLLTGGAIVVAAASGAALTLVVPARRPPARPASPAVAATAIAAAPIAAVRETVNVADMRARARDAARRNAPAEAEALLERAIALSPSDAECWNDLGVVRVRLGQLHGGIEAFEQGLAVQPANAELQRNLAVALDRDGQRAAAETHYRAFLTLAPRHPDRAAVERRLATP